MHGHVRPSEVSQLITARGSRRCYWIAAPRHRPPRWCNASHVVLIPKSPAAALVYWMPVPVGFGDRLDRVGLISRSKHRSKHRALFEGLRDGREWMAGTGTSSHSRKLHSRRLALRASQTSHRLLSWADVTINKYCYGGPQFDLSAVILWAILTKLYSQCIATKRNYLINELMTIWHRASIWHHASTGCCFSKCVKALAG
jgi:hypothetical protein